MTHANGKDQDEVPTAACALPDPVVHARMPFMGDRALSAQNDFVVHHLCYSCVIFTDRPCRQKLSL